MNQLFYNITGGIVHQIRCEKGTTISEVIVRGKRNIKENGNGFISIFLLKARVLKLTISKRKNLRLPLKVETDQFFFCLVFPECPSTKIFCISPSDSEANRDGSDAESPFPLFFSLSASFKNSSPRGKVGKLFLFWDWWAESLFVSIIVPKYNILPLANNSRSRGKKISG